jgi:type IV pilus assembly protein PilM
MSPSLNLNMAIGRGGGESLVGLDIQPGLVAAVQARVTGSPVVERAVSAKLDSDVVREGDVVDGAALSEALRKLFHGSRLSKRVRLGVANQRTVMRTLELPPVTDRKDLAAAVQFQAQDQVPMPLANAVLDFQPLGIVETPGGPRQRVVLVAAQRDMVERLLAAVRGAGLTPVGVDMSAFAMIRSLYRSDVNDGDRVLYLNVDGLTNVAIAEGTVCRFTRVLGGGIEELASQLAERRAIPLDHARGLLADVDLTTPAAEESQAASPANASVGAATADLATEVDDAAPEPHAGHQDRAPQPERPAQDVSGEGWPATASESERAQGYAEELASSSSASAAQEARAVLENGVRAIAGEVRNSLDFQRSQEGGADVARVVLSGSALELSGFAQALETSLGVEVVAETVGVSDRSEVRGLSPQRLAVATGLAAAEISR